MYPLEMVYDCMDIYTDTPLLKCKMITYFTHCFAPFLTLQHLESVDYTCRTTLPFKWT